MSHWDVAFNLVTVYNEEMSTLRDTALAMQGDMGVELAGLETNARREKDEVECAERVAVIHAQSRALKANPNISHHDFEKLDVTMKETLSRDSQQKKLAIDAKHARSRRAIQRECRARLEPIVDAIKALAYKMTGITGDDYDIQSFLDHGCLESSIISGF